MWKHKENLTTMSWFTTMQLSGKRQPTMKHWSSSVKGSIENIQQKLEKGKTEIAVQF